MWIEATEATIAQAIQHLKAGELIALPTETVYGLAAHADDDLAVSKIFTTKQRPANHPLIVHVKDASVVPHYSDHVPDFAHALIAAFWPGPLTLILPRRAGIAAAAAGGQTTIGLRCPAHPVAHTVLVQAHAQGIMGLAAPSANHFGRVSPTTAQHVHDEFGDALFILDGGPCEVGIESAIVDCTRGTPVILRPGVLTREQIEAIAQTPHETHADTATAPRASGTLASHYVPRAHVHLMSAPALQAALANDPADATGIALYSRTVTPPRHSNVHYRTMPTDAAAAARELFAALRQFDAQGVSQIWIEQPPQTSDWEGVRDRLERAATRH